MRSFIKYVSYTFVFLIAMVGSCYGAITLSMNNSAKQQAGPGLGGGITTPELPKQITSIVENITSSSAIELDLIASVDAVEEDYLITLNTSVDLSKGFENAAVQGSVNARLIQSDASYDIDFVYQNGKVYIDMFNGKFSVDTNNVMEPVMQIMNIVGVEMPDMGEMDLSSMNINDMLSLLSDLTETKNPDGTVTLDINIAMLNTVIQLICDENYKILEIVVPTINLDGTKINLETGVSYPEDLQIVEKNEEEYNETANLLTAINGLVKYFNDDQLAFEFNLKYDNIPLQGKIFANLNNSSVKAVLEVENFEINLILIEGTIYIEYQNVFAKFELKDFDKVNNFLQESFDITLPLEEIKEMMTDVQNGNLDSIMSGSSDIDTSEIDLSIIEKVYVEGDKTIVVIKDIGEAGITLSNDNLKSISFVGYGVDVTLNTIEYNAFQLNQEKDNYIDVVRLIPTIQNVIEIANNPTLTGTITIKKDNLSIPVNLLINSTNGLFVEAWVDIGEEKLQLNYVNDKIYINLANKFKVLMEADKIDEQLIEFLSGLDVEIELGNLSEVIDIVDDLLNTSINPLLITGLNETVDGLEISILNCLNLSIINGEDVLYINTTIESIDINAQIQGCENVVNIPNFNDEEFNDTKEILNLATAFINSGMLDVTLSTINYFADGMIGFDFTVDYQDQTVSGQLNYDLSTNKFSVSVDYQNEIINIFLLDGTIYFEYRNIFFKFAFADFEQVNNILVNQFGIKLPLKPIAVIIDIANSQTIEEAFEKIEDIMGDSLNDFEIDLSVINLEFFDRIIIDGNDTIIPVGDNTITVTSANNTLSNVKFEGIVNANISFVDYVNKSLAVDENMFIDLADFIPTVENVIDIVKSNTIYGTITVTNNDIEIPVYFTISKSKQLYAEAWTEFEGNKISMQYFNGKLYLNVADKFKVMSVCESLPAEIEKFLTELNIQTPEFDATQIIGAMLGIFDNETYPLLIKGLTQTSNGFDITLFNDIVVNVANQTKTLNISTSVDEFDINIEVNGKDCEVILPEIQDNDFNAISSVFDLTSNFITSGMLDITLGTINYFTSLSYGFDIDIEYQGHQLTGKVYFDVNSLKTSIEINYKGESLKVLIIDEIVYLEFRNIYLKFAFEDVGLIDSLLKNKFGIDIPLEIVGKVIDISNSSTIDEAITGINELIGDKFNDFEIDLSIIDIQFFKNIIKNNNEFIIPVDDSNITVSLKNDKLSNVKFEGVVNAAVQFIEYTDIELSIGENSYINLSEFIPTIENAIDIAKSKTISGTINISNADMEIPVYFTVANSETLFAEIWVELEGNKISMQYLDGKVYLNFADKFKLMSVVEDLPSAIEDFINELNIQLDEEVDSSELTDTLMDIINVEINPLLIKALEQTPEGFIITLFNDIQISLANNSRIINISTSIEGYSINVEVNGNDATTTIPEINDEEFNRIESLLDIIKAFVQSGMLDVSISAINYFKDFNLGLNLDIEYQGYQFEGTLFFDIEDKKLSVNAVYDGHRINVLAINETIYLELGNVFLKYNANDVYKIDEIANKYFDVDLPLEIMDDILAVIRCETIDEVITEIQNIIDKNTDSSSSNQEFNVDLSVIDLDFFNNITVEGNNTTIPVGDNTITVTVVEKLLTNIAFKGLLNANLEFIEYQDKELSESESSYIDLADFIPTVENAISIVQSNTISGQVTIVDGDQTYPIDFVISKDGDYAEFKTVVYQANLSVQYNQGKVYICFADHINLISELGKLPEAINTLLDGLDTGISIEEQNSYIDMLYDVIDPDKHPLLFTGFTQTTNGFILSIYNGVNVYLDNSSNRLDVTTNVNGISIDGYITGSESVVNIPTFNDNSYIPIENIFKFVNAVKNMAKQKDFHIAGSIDIDGDLIGIGINWNVPLDFKLKIVNGEIEAMATMGPIPTMVGVNNDVPYQFDDTESGSGRTVSIYYKDNALYLYRTETINQFFGDGRVYEKCTKITMDTFMSNIMYYLQYCLGFTDSIMGAIDDAIQKSMNREGAINLNNIIKGFTVNNTGDKLTIVLNMAEIANNELMGDLSLNISLRKNGNGDDIISNIGLSIYMPLAEGVFTLTLNSNDLHFVDYGKEVDMSKLYDYVNKYPYKYDEEWEGNDGSWKKSSEKTYTIRFEENGGEEVADISGAFGTEIKLPTFKDMVSDDGVKHVIRTFDGWWKTATFDEGTQFTSNTIPKGDTTLYAKWIEDVKYYRNISFVTNSNDVLENLRALETTQITLPSLTIKEVTTETSTTVYSFAGWFIDSELTEEFLDYVMPSEDITLYAKWEVLNIEEASLLQLYDNGELIYSRYLFKGDTIDLSKVGKVNSETQLYYNAGYTTLYDGSFIMPDDDLTLYIRNKYLVTVSSSYGTVVNNQFYVWQGDALNITAQSTYVVDDYKTIQTTYTFNGYKVNGIIQAVPSVMTNYNLSFVADWTITSKKYFTVSFNTTWVKCDEWMDNNNNFSGKITCKSAPTSVSSFLALEGSVINPSQYNSTCKYEYKAVWVGKDYNFKVLTWNTEGAKNISNGVNNGSYTTLTSYTITGNVTFFATWGTY